MTIQTFLTYLTSISGFIAAIVLVKGAINISSEFIADWATLWQDENEHIVRTVVGQKTDSLVGATVLSLSFLLGFSSLVLPEKYLQAILLEYPFGGCVIFFLSLLMLSLSFHSRAKIYKIYYKKVKTLINDRKMNQNY